MLIDENYIEFSISIWRNVPVVNTKLCRFTVVVTSLHQWTDVKDEWGHKAAPCCKLKYLIVNILWHCTNILLYIKFWLLIDKLKVYGILFKKLGLATFWWGVAIFGRSLLSGGGVATFGGPLLSAWIYQRPQKIDVIFGGSLLSELYGTCLTSGICALKLWIKMDVLIAYHLALEGHPVLDMWIWSCQLFISKPRWRLLVEFPGSYQVE